MHPVRLALYAFAFLALSAAPAAAADGGTNIPGAVGAGLVAIGAGLIGGLAEVMEIGPALVAAGALGAIILILWRFGGARG